MGIGNANAILYVRKSRNPCMNLIKYYLNPYIMKPLPAYAGMNEFRRR